MHIQYFGLSSFKFIGKTATVVTDPFDKSVGLTSPRGNADLVILSEFTNPEFSAVSGLSDTKMIIKNPGEYDTLEVTITGIPVKQERGFITNYLIEIEDIKILNLTHAKTFAIKQDDLESLGDIDVLILPVGGNEVMDAKTARQTVLQIQPQIVIPSYYELPGLNKKLAAVDDFLKEMGAKPEPTEKLILKRKDLQAETIRVELLQALKAN